ncbi:hypothetical protein E2C01_003138 [Portunus trituberculatus]|uniref:Uncharacterized protein n=1 Tax=Portunus trituberculatus TaxID=210409 RepID=A0A5B7CLE2_PORTR|nr:hypothetical protein [Portunus trituberculatus]
MDITTPWWKSNAKHRQECVPVRPVIGVDVHVFSEGTLAGEATPTLTTHKWLLSCRVNNNL